MVERFGKPREGDALAEPYIHIAAAAQEMLERTAIALIETHLGDTLRRTGRLCLAGGCALNVVMNRRLIEHPLVRELFVPPAPNDAGLPLGAAALACAARGIETQRLDHAYWGPEFSDAEIEKELEGVRLPYRRLADPALAGASLLTRGDIVGWFQGRMEWGPRALGNRSILGHPGLPGTEREINERIKFRETWRPFCPSVLEEYAAEVLGSEHPCPFMTYSFRLPEAWKSRIPEVTHVDGTARPQIVSSKTNPLFHQLIAEFKKRTELPCVINTSLNRRGEPMITSPRDALKMFYGSGLEHLIMGNFYVAKNPSAPPPEGLAHEATRGA
jgi:carbamoyltransferase